MCVLINGLIKWREEKMERAGVGLRKWGWDQTRWVDVS